MLNHQIILIDVNLIFLNILMGLWVFFFIAYEPIKTIMDRVDGNP